MTFGRDIRTVTAAACVFWSCCAGVGLYANFPTPDGLAGQSHFDAVRIHVLDYFALALIPTLLLKEAVWMMTRKPKGISDERFLPRVNTRQAKSTPLPEDTVRLPFFMSTPVEPRSTLAQPQADAGQFKPYRAPELRSDASGNCQPHQYGMLMQAEHLVTFRDCIPERRIYRIALDA